MGIALRITIPDQPGALARAAQAVARAGADVMSVTVLESESGRAVDELRLRWPVGKNEKMLLDAVTACPGTAVLGCRRTRWLLDGRPDLDLLSSMLAVPERGMETLIDMAPAALDADWAELRAPARRLPALYSTNGVPRDDLAPDTMPVRAQGMQSALGVWAYLPLEQLRSILVLGRDGGPAFLRSELAHADRVLDLAMTMLDRVLTTSGYGNASELTAHLAAAGGG
jgi:hypothetical protein